MRKFWLSMTGGVAVLGFILGLSTARADEATPQPTPAEKAPGSLSERVGQLEKKLASYEESSDQKFKQVQEDQLRLHFNLYGDAEYRVFGPAANFPLEDGFYLGQTDLHIMAQYGAHLSAMSEDVVEFDGQEPSIDLERIVVFYTLSDQLRLGAGRDHTAFGYWNRTYHHGSQFQTTIDRPFFLAFEDGGGSDLPFKKSGVVPNHIVGAFASGKFDLGSSSLGYELNVGNNGNIGLSVDPVTGAPVESSFNFDPEGDDFHSKRMAGRLVFKPDAGGGLALGLASVLNHYRVSADNAPADPSLAFSKLVQLLLEGEVIYTDENFELLSEFYNFDDNLGDGDAVGSANNTAFYVQIGYQVTPDLKPYFRVENLNVDANDAFFKAMLYSNETVYLVGLRYDIVPVVSSLKLEAHFINANGANATEVATAWGFGF
ncbi:MAG TPA: hypothetical protein VMV05_06650 [bacterium]|nr:hypothetical protein [bacterium]